MIEYRHVLKKYMRLIIEAEGCNYIDLAYRCPDFNPEEIDALNRLEYEIESNTDEGSYGKDC